MMERGRRKASRRAKGDDASDDDDDDRKAQRRRADDEKDDLVSALPREARRLLDRAEGLRDGAATIEPTLLRELGAMPPEHATAVCERFVSNKLGEVRNLNGFLVSVINSMRSAGAFGGGGGKLRR